MFYFKDEESKTITGAFKGVPACHKVLSAVISTISAEPSFSTSPYCSVTSANVYSELHNLMVKYNNDRVDDLIDALINQSICINPTAAIQITLSEIYQHTVRLSNDNLKNYPSCKKVIEAQKTLTMIQTPIFNFRNQFYTKFNKSTFAGIESDVSVGSDDESCTTAELIKSIDYSADFVTKEDARRIFKFLFKSFWLMCLIYKGQRYIQADKMGSDMYSLLAYKWTADTYEWEKADSAAILSDMNLINNIHAKYFNIYKRNTDVYGPCLAQATITNIAVGATNRAIAQKAINYGLEKAYALYRHDKTLQDPKFKSLKSDTTLWARYMYVLLSNVNQPFLNETNPRNYTVDDILYFITASKEVNSNSLASQVPIQYLAPDYVDNYSTYEEWAESLNDVGMSGTRDYLLNYCPNNFISIPNIQIQSLESVIQEQTSNEIIVEKNNGESITKLQPRLYTLNNLGKLMCLPQSASPFKELYEILFDQILIRQDVQIRSTAKNIVLPTQEVEDNLIKYNKAFSSSFYTSRETLLLQSYQREVEQTRENLFSAGDVNHLLDGVAEWSDVTVKCIQTVTDAAVREYKKTILNTYKTLNINSRYSVRPKNLEDILRKNIAYNGPAECLAILGEPIIAEVNLLSNGQYLPCTMAFLANHRLLIISRDSDSYHQVDDQYLSYDEKTGKYYYQDNIEVARAQ